MAMYPIGSSIIAIACFWRCLPNIQMCTLAIWWSVQELNEDQGFNYIIAITPTDFFPDCCAPISLVNPNLNPKMNKR